MSPNLEAMLRRKALPRAGTPAAEQQAVDTRRSGVSRAPP